MRSFLRCAPLLLSIAFGVPLAAQPVDLSATWQAALTAARQAKAGSDWKAANDHYAAALQAAEAFPDGDSRLPRTLEEIASAWQHQRERDKALAAQERAVALRTATLAGGGATIELSESVFRLAQLQRTFGALDEAEKRMRQALDVRAAVPDVDAKTSGPILRELSQVITDLRPEDTEAGTLLERNLATDDTPRNRALLARYWAKRGEHERAVAFFLSAIAGEKETLRPDPRHLASLHKALADEYVALERPADAEAALLESLAVREAHLGARHPQIAFALKDLGELYIAQERWSDAEHVLLRGAELNRAAWGGTNDRCACNVSELLAKVDEALGRTPVSAKAAAERTSPERATAERAATEIAPVAEAAVAPAAVAAPAPSADDEVEQLDARIEELQKKGEMDQAKDVARQSLEARAKLHGQASAEYASGLDRLGRLLREQRRYDEAYEIHRQQLGALEAAGLGEAAEAAPVLHALGELARDLDREAEAEQYLLRENVLRANLGQNLRVVHVLESLGGLHLAADNPARAEYYLDWAVRTWEQLAGPEAPELARVSSALARALIALGRNADAEALLVERIAFEDAKAYVDGGSLVQLLQPLKTVYAATGRTAEAAAVDARLGELRGLRNPPAAPKRVEAGPAS